ncbi:hypothetical protein ACIPC1_39625 [Streptomyces sp. NPDC087263]|uniref:hypothetical protein n=1 Tax=Streptomyces sp. NPDC087263 TaxID=3365773 RepID=UPI00381477BB
MSEPTPTRVEVEEQVQEVSARYSEQLLLERRVGAPDAERMKLLRDGLAECAADLASLPDADAAQLKEIAARYAARLKEFRGQ